MPDGGYTTSSESMQRAQVRLQEAAEEPKSEASKVAPTEITKEEFGKAHGGYHEKYKTGMDEIGAAMKGLSGELSGLGGNIGSAGQRYDTQEGDAGATATNSGKDL